MLELLDQIRDETFYHPNILCLLGNAFINRSLSEPILLDAECLQALGAYLINRLKQHTHTIPERTLYRIAFAKRWDTTEKTGRSFKTVLHKDSSHYQSIIDTQLNDAIKANSLGETVFNILLKALEHAPQKHNEFAEIKNNVSSDELMQSLNYLINRLANLDANIKADDLEKRFNATKNLSAKCTLSIYMAANSTYGLSMDLLEGYDLERVDKSELMKANLEDITFLCNFMLDHLNKSGFFAALDTHAKSSMTIKKIINVMLLDFARDASKISKTKIQEIEKFIEQLLSTIEDDLITLNSNYEIFSQLLTTLKTAPLDTVSADLISIVERHCQQVLNIKVQFESTKTFLTYHKETVEYLESALSQSSSEVYRTLQQMFLDFDKRFANPPKDSINNLKNLQITLNEISESVNGIKKIMHEKSETDDKTLKFNVNYLDYHTASNLLKKVQQHIENLSDKSLKFNVEKDKCFAFEYALNRLQGEIHEMDFDEKTAAIKYTYLAATKSYEGIWQVQIRCMYTTTVMTTITELNRDLHELESILSNSIKQKESQLQKNTATPPAHIRHKSMQEVSQGTPRRTFISHVKRKNLLSDFFKAEDPKKPCIQPVADTDKENSPNTVNIPTPHLT